MPRGPRLDAPGTLHHVIIRGIEQGSIVRDDTDRKSFLDRMGLQALGSGTCIYVGRLGDVWGDLGTLIRCLK